MPNTRMGKLPPRYFYMLNPYSDVRLSKCPMCQKLTHQRKFALVIHIDKSGPLAFGKTCRYCSRCELIMVHQDELEGELAYSFSQIAPDVVGNEYMVLGTMGKKAWAEGFKGCGPELKELLNHVADFKKVYDLKCESGGWYPADDKVK